MESTEKTKRAIARHNSSSSLHKIVLAKGLQDLKPTKSWSDLLRAKASQQPKGQTKVAAKRPPSPFLQLPVEPDLNPEIPTQKNAKENVSRLARQNMKKTHGPLPSPQRHHDVLDVSTTSVMAPQNSSASDKEKASKVMQPFRKRTSSPRQQTPAEPEKSTSRATASSSQSGGGNEFSEHEVLESSGFSGEQTGSGSSDVTDDTLDVIDGSSIGPEGSTDSARRRDTIERLHIKIHNVNDMIKQEQSQKEDNVNEYLRLSSATDKAAQAQRIKTVFEKRNRQSTQTIAQLTKKLEAYQKRLDQIEHHGLPRKQNVLKDVGQGLKDVGSNIRDGISGLSGGVVDNIRGAKDTLTSKPKELAHLIKKNFESTENVTPSKSTDDATASGEDPLLSDASVAVHDPSMTSLGTDSLSPRVKSPQDEEGEDEVASLASTESSPLNIPSLSPKPTFNDLEIIRRELEESSREVAMQLLGALDQNRRDMEDLSQSLRQALDEERYRCERLEEQLNDLMELHQNEVANLKQEMQAMEEKMEYQLMERTRDMQEVLDSCQTRVTKMELQQQQQQIISMETFENSSLRNILTKLINVVLAILAVVLVLASSVVNMVGPFMSTRMRVASTILLIIFTIYLWTNWSAVKAFFLSIHDIFR